MIVIHDESDFDLIASVTGSQLSGAVAAGSID